MQSLGPAPSPTVPPSEVVAFWHFMALHVQDPHYEPRFRARFASQKACHGQSKERDTVQQIWRVNNHNKYVLDMVDAQLVASGCVASTVFDTIRSAERVVWTVAHQPRAVCAVTGVAVEWPSRLQCWDDAERCEPTTTLWVRSDFDSWLQCYNLVAHYVDYATRRLTPVDSTLQRGCDVGGGGGALGVETDVAREWELLSHCRATLVRLAEQARDLETLY